MSRYRWQLVEWNKQVLGLRATVSLKLWAIYPLYERNVANTSHRYCVDFIGCRADDKLNSRLPAWYTKCCQAKYLYGYLADDIHLASESSARSLRSSSERKCSVTRVHSRYGDRCFAAAGPRIWNNLPASLRDKEVSCTEFIRQLKTFMFQTDCGASWLFWLLRLINTLTYLLTYYKQLLIGNRLFVFSTPNIFRDPDSKLVN